MDRVIIISEEGRVKGFFMNQEGAYNYILNTVERLKRENNDDYTEQMIELIESYDRFCNGAYEYFGIDSMDIYAECADNMDYLL